MLNINILSFLSLNLFFVILSSCGSPVFAVKKSYIVYMGQFSQDLPLTDELLRIRTESHIDFVGSLLGGKKKAEEAIFYSYRRNINGFAAELDDEEVAAIQRHPEVISVLPNEERKLLTTHSWEFLSLERNGIVPSDSLWEKARYGEDIVIANFDSGVWPENPSFNDKGFGPIPSKWKGSCEKDRGSPFPCNRKLIGAKYFYEGFIRGTGNANSTIDSARDYDGHGSHTLSTAGGSFVPGASFLGLYNATAKGGSPKARVAAYKVCWPGCYDADILKAYEHAIADGVDVISISLGGDLSGDYYTGAIVVGAFAAIQRGITVVAAGGNGGPTSGTIGNVAPWIITVAASTTDRDILSYVHLENGVCLKGKSMFKPLLEESFYPIISGVDARKANASASEASFCMPRALDPEKVKGKILVCVVGEVLFMDMEKNAVQAGAVGIILCNDKTNGNDLSVYPFLLPMSYISYTDSLTLFAYINSTKNPRGLIAAPKAEFGIKPAPLMASFSSRGPNSVTPEILKPDVAAPGVDIIAAYSEEASPTDDPSDKRRTKYLFMSGTSMACPHVAGVVGLLKVLHPDWSSAAIRSALMTTASTFDNTGKPMLDQSLVEATPFSYGAGHIQPEAAADPGLVYDLSVRDYEDFLCVIYNATTVKKFTDDITCGDNVISLLDFNYPSISVPKLSSVGSVSVNRRVKNVGSAGIYVAKIRQPFGVSVSVQPKSLQFEKIGDVRNFQLVLTRINGTSGKNGTYSFGELIWSDGKHSVRSPIVVGTT